MYLALPFFIYFLLLIISIRSSSTSNALNGKHLRTIWVKHVWISFTLLLVRFSPFNTIPGIQFSSNLRHVGVEIPKDWRGRSKEVSSSKPCQNAGISRNWKNPKNFLFFYIFHGFLNACTYYTTPRPFSCSRYEMVRVNETLLEPPPNGRGLYSYLWENVKFISCSITHPRVQKWFETHLY